MGAKDPRDNVYQQVLFDFTYLKAPEVYEKKLSANVELVEADSEFQESHNILVARFYKLFSNIVKYVEDLNKYLSDLRANFYMQYTVEDVMLNIDGKQVCLMDTFCLFRNKNITFSWFNFISICGLLPYHICISIPPH